MGQLEKYGLYVLCLVIFMILGVALWGDPGTVAAGGGRREAAPMNVGGAASQKDAKAPPAIAGVDLDALLSPGNGGKEKGVQQPPPRGSDPGPGNGGNKPSATPTPTPDSKRATYVIKSGDSFETIARTQLNDIGLRDLIMQMNPDVLPTRMKLGKELVLPSPAEIAARKPTPVAKDASTAKVDAKGDPKAVNPVVPATAGERLYTVQKGDSFERIATVLLGSKKRTQELMQMNAGIKPQDLRIGHRIKLPTK